MNTKKYEEIHRWNYLRKSQVEDRTIKMLKKKYSKNGNIKNPAGK